MSGTVHAVPTAIVFCLAAIGARADMKVAVVNMIPRGQSGEVNHDAEPNLAVNPADRRQIAGSALTPGPLGANAPIYVSTDGGKTWSLNYSVPSVESTLDITVRFAESGTLYAGIVRRTGDDDDRSVSFLNILKSSDFTKAKPMNLLARRPGVDQPYVSSMRLPAGPDRIFVGSGSLKREASVHSLGGPANPASLKTILLDSRKTEFGNGPQVRCAIHASGTVYATFYSWRKIRRPNNGKDGKELIRGLVTVDVVVVRDDNWGTGPNAFQAIRDPADNKPGRIVAFGRTLPWMYDIADLSFGQERIGGDLAIATDPRPDQGSTVYLCWADRVGANDYTLHLCQSKDRGATWSRDDLLTFKNAKNPGLAINSLGHVGFVFQELLNADVPAQQRWKTRMQVRDKNFGLIKEFTLANTPAQDPPRGQGSLYLGDYLHLMSVDRDFYGVFAASNAPDLNNFPAGVTYQRRVDFGQKKLLDAKGTQVKASIDPFFFKVTGDQ